ncbi:Uncharacterized protein PECH_002031 [Penicillium ucsense]|uniref:Uncharacterized protein n=1 Tax=Penicillium ucsense TaxID=2839758 RepID=A0A8J8WI76_9EURO|nr:Uncharacterized protein PECM_004330 [Penicillium ucsense]KAF7731311.1 Uncharacterized protein PECH_002031 [Penicillium ucsense]
MCIALVSTAHPAYSLIVIDNRDEFLRRPTSSVDWWPEPASFVLGSRDMAREDHGTWMGVTKQGKVAVLTNFREDHCAQAVGVQSRGRIVNSWLTGAPEQNQTTLDFVRGMVASPATKQVGGFSLLCGRLSEPLAIVSNRSTDLDQITWVAAEKNQTRGLSNTSFDDRTWPKILNGEQLMERAIKDHAQAQEDEEALLSRLLGVLSTDSLPRLPEEASVEEYIAHLRHSIFVPKLGQDDEIDPAAGVAAARVEDEAKQPLVQDYLSGPYGTQKQTILLARPDGRVRYFERTLYDNNAQAVPTGTGDRSFEFHIEQ